MCLIASVCLSIRLSVCSSVSPLTAVMLTKTLEKEKLKVNSKRGQHVCFGIIHVCGIMYTGDDAVGVKWQDMSSDLELYASHKHFIQNTANRHSAHW